MKKVQLKPALLLQKPHGNCESKDHVNVLEQRFEWWKRGDFRALHNGAETL